MKLPFEEYEALRANAARTELAEAQRDAALDALGELVAIVRGTGGYMKPEQQASLRCARALLAGAGRSVP